MNHPDCTEALVRAGCDTSLQDVSGKTGREVAQQKKHAAVLERLDALEQHDAPPEKLNEEQKNGQKMSPALCTAVAHGQEAAAQLLLDRRANPNIASSNGVTLPITRLLLEAKAEVNTTDKEEFTAHHHACANNHPDIVEALVRAGCDTSLRNNNGETGRDIAQAEDYAAVLERLDTLEAEANRQKDDHAAGGPKADELEASPLLNAADAAGETQGKTRQSTPKAQKLRAAALLKAAEEGDEALSQVLANANIDVNAAVEGELPDGTVFDTTALNQAARHDREPEARRLLN
eukprot:COSAG04_NODE_9346_length_872_cov_0.924968_1_plen_290_part_11